MKWRRRLVWEIRVSETAKKQLGKLDKPTAKRITLFLRERVAILDDPRSRGEALKGQRLGDFWKYRVGDYRIIVSINDGAVCVLVVEVGHRKEIDQAD